MNGRAASANAYPFQVSVQRNKFEGGSVLTSKFCGGVILDKDYILTAAHCFNNDASIGNLSVHAGSLDAFNIYSPTSQLLKVKKIIMHPGYAPGAAGHADDIAMLKLESPAKFNQAVQPVYLPPQGYEATGKGKIVGWGAINNDETVSSSQLLEAEIDVSPIAECEKYWRMIGQQICLGANSRTNACGGDSGGPFLQTIVSIVLKI